MGLTPSFCVYDEFGQTADRELYDAMDSAIGARANPLMLVISTQAATTRAHVTAGGLWIELRRGTRIRPSI